MQRDAIAGQAPDIQGALLDGQQVQLAGYKGKPVLLHFWATWCGICRFEQDSINDIATDHPVLTVAMTSGQQHELQAYMLKHKLTFPVLTDNDAKLSGRYGVSGVPASFVIDSHGQVRFTEIGYTSEWGLRLRLWLASFY